MSLRSVDLIWFLFFVLLTSPVAAAPEVKRYDDPLPAGAVARIGTLKMPRQGNVAALAFSPDGKTLMTLGSAGRIRWWNARTGERLERSALDRTHWNPVPGSPGRHFDHYSARTMAISRDGRLLLIWDSSEYISLMNALTCDEKQRFNLNQTKQMQIGLYRDVWPIPPIAFLAFGADDKTFVAVDARAAGVWNVATGRNLKWFVRHEKPTIQSVALDPKGHNLVMGAVDGTVSVWDVASARELRRFQGHGGYGVFSVVFSPNGNTLASVGGDGFVSLWDTKDYSRRRRFAKPTGWTSFVVFSTDGKLVGSDSGNTFSLWDAATGKVRYRLEGHESRVGSAAFTPDGKWLATGCEDGTAIVWDFSRLSRVPDAQTAQSRAPDAISSDPLPAGALSRLGTTHLRHEDCVFSVAFSPDGKTLASVSRDIHLWDLTDGHEIRRFKHQFANRIAFSPDGKILAGASHQEVFFLDPATGEKIHQFRPHPNGVSHFVFSPDGKAIATAGDSNGKDFAIRLWDVATEKPIREFLGHETSVNALAFSGDGRRLISMGFKGRILIWDVVSAKSVRQLEIPSRWPIWPSFSPNGHSMFYFDEGSTFLKDLDTGKILHRVSTNCQHGAGIFSPDGKILASGAVREPIRLWDTITGKELRTLPIDHGWAHPAVFSPDGRVLATTSATGEFDFAVRLWDVATSQEVRPGGTPRASVSCVAFSPDSRMVASGTADKTVSLWDVKTGKELRQFSKHEGKINSIALSPNGKVVASGDSRNRVILWDQATGQERCRWDEPRNDRWTNPIGTRALVFSAVGKTVIAGSQDGIVTFLDADSAKVLLRFKGHDGFLASLALSADGRIMASAGSDGDGFYSDGIVRLWDAATGKTICSLTFTKPKNERERIDSTEIYHQAVFSPDGKILAVAASKTDQFHGHFYDHGIRLWEVATRRPTQFMETAGKVVALAFSADGKTLVSSAAGARRPNGASAVQVWNPATGRQIGRLDGHLSWVNGLSFSPNGRLLATGSADGTVLIWDATWPQWKNLPARLKELSK